MTLAILRDLGPSLIDEDIARIARNTRCIAMVGLSTNESRPAWGVARYLKSQGFRVIPVNPQHAGQTILDEIVYADLRAVPADCRVDMVDIFRRPEAVPEIVDAALEMPCLRVIWMQLGISHPPAANRARARGLTVIEDRCAKIEFSRFL
ncbi:MULTISPECIES: CoA-binding protein [unclassified Paracoccus (in: a-proteobacteria)]|uniref:CoA-binding protein n=1 Tax=unclassified Paracoccus (in: a-proteobacteria) TaxID=2688777 RepID=UPI0012B3832B|nr:MULTISPECIES: CoA-binding protein [unclassified Paracoccus (in: a-proteobacteria)]UXU74795.1 CoA-binding protein [Paracoccus sp. SMMA_5]UXU80692.1 CoA-binding protein [Paracoccus sp. SMMA_5_TC]